MRAPGHPHGGDVEVAGECKGGAMTMHGREPAEMPAELTTTVARVATLIDQGKHTRALSILTLLQRRAGPDSGMDPDLVQALRQWGAVVHVMAAVERAVVDVRQVDSLMEVWGKEAQARAAILCVPRVRQSG